MMSQRIRWFFYFWMAVFLFTVTWWSASPIGNGDVFMYLSLARHFLEVDFFPSWDPFIAQKLQFHLHHEWLAYFYYFIGFQIWGLQGVIAAKVLLSFMLFCLLVWFGKRTGNLNWGSLPVLILCAVAVAPRLGERAYLFSDLLMIAVIGLLQLFEKERKLKWILPFPFIFLLWVQLHPGFPLGFVWIGLFLCLRLQTFSKKESIWLGGSLVASLLFVLINPMGLQGFLYPFEKFLDPQWDIYRQINSEWMPTYQSPYIPGLSKLSLAVLAGFGLLVSFSEGRRRNFFALVVTIVMSFLAFQSMRFMTTAAFAFSILWLTSDSLQETLAWIRKKQLLANLAIILSTAFTLAFSFSVFEKEDQGLIRLIEGPAKAYGPKAAWQVLQQRPDGVVFAEWDWNSILSWWSEGRFKVVVHGHVDRPDFAVHHFLSITRSEEDFKRIVRDNQIRYFLLAPETLLNPQSVLSRKLQSPDWKVLFRDESSVLFEKNESQNGQRNRQ